MATIYGRKKKPISVDEMRTHIPSGGVRVREHEDGVCLVEGREGFAHIQCRVDVSSLPIEPDPGEPELEEKRVEIEYHWGTAKKVGRLKRVHPAEIDLNFQKRRELVRVENALNALYGLPPDRLPLYPPWYNPLHLYAG